jgi:hypothetical protein
LQWSIANKQLDCAADLHPIAQAVAAILADMANRQKGNLTWREKMKLVKNGPRRVVAL